MKNETALMVAVKSYNFEMLEVLSTAFRDARISLLHACTPDLVHNSCATWHPMILIAIVSSRKDARCLRTVLSAAVWSGIDTQACPSFDP